MKLLIVLLWEKMILIILEQYVCYFSLNIYKKVTFFKILTELILIEDGVRLFFIPSCTAAASPDRGRYRAAKPPRREYFSSLSPSPSLSPSSLPAVEGMKRWHPRSRCQPLRPASRPADSGLLPSEMASTEPPAA